MTNTTWTALADLQFGDALADRPELGMFYAAEKLPSRMLAGYAVPYTGLLFSAGYLRLPSDAVVPVDGTVPEPPF